MIQRDAQKTDEFFHARQKAHEKRKNTIMCVAFFGLLPINLFIHDRYGNEAVTVVTFLLIAFFLMGYFCDRSEWDKSREEREYYDALKLVEGAPSDDA